MNGLLAMEGKWYDVAAVKEYLNSYREKERDIDNQIERLERLMSKMTSVGAQVLTDMPKAPGGPGDKIAGMVVAKEELESAILKGREEQSSSWEHVENVLKGLKHSDEKAVIRMRYHDCESWNIVTEMMFGNKEDFCGKEDSYLRRVHKIHGSALLNIAKIISAEKGDI